MYVINSQEVHLPMSLMPHTGYFFRYTELDLNAQKAHVESTGDKAVRAH